MDLSHHPFSGREERSAQFLNSDFRKLSHLGIDSPGPAANYHPKLSAKSTPQTFGPDSRGYNSYLPQSHLKKIKVEVDGLFKDGKTPSSLAFGSTTRPKTAGGNSTCLPSSSLSLSLLQVYFLFAYDKKNTANASVKWNENESFISKTPGTFGSDKRFDVSTTYTSYCKSTEVFYKLIDIEH